MVAKEICKVDQCNDRPVLERIDEDTDLVAWDWWEVIHKDYTVPLTSFSTKPTQSKLSKQMLAVLSHDGKATPISLPIEVNVNSDNSHVSSIIQTNNTPSPPLPPPNHNLSIDRREETETATSIEQQRCFVIINSREKRVNKVGAFVPENFTTEDEQRLGDLLEEAYCIFHNMHLFRVRTRLPKDSWIDLSYDYCDRRFPNWRRLRHRLLDGILERTEVESCPELGIVVPRGIKGHRCYGYRFAKEEYRQATVRKRPITNPELLQAIEAHRNVKYPVQRWLERKLQQVEIADVPEERLLELAMGEHDPQARFHSYKEQVELITDKGWVFVVDDFSRRVHTNLTQLKRELRASLRVAGSPLVQIDMALST